MKTTGRDLPSVEDRHGIRKKKKISTFVFAIIVKSQYHLHKSTELDYHKQSEVFFLSVIAG